MSHSDRGQFIALFDAQGNRIRNISYPGPYFTANLAPDGHAIAGGCGDPDRNICLVHLDGTVTRITNSPPSSGVIWSPDSIAIAYDTHRDPARFGIAVKPLAEGAAEREVLSSDEGLHPFSWHPDGAELYFLGPGQTITAVGVSNTNNKLMFGKPRALFSPPILALPLADIRLTSTRRGRISL